MYGIFKFIHKKKAMILKQFIVYWREVTCANLDDLCRIYQMDFLILYEVTYNIIVPIIALTPNIHSHNNDNAY